MRIENRKSLFFRSFLFVFCSFFFFFSVFTFPPTTKTDILFVPQNGTAVLEGLIREEASGHGSSGLLMVFAESARLSHGARGALCFSGLPAGYLRSVSAVLPDRRSHQPDGANVPPRVYGEAASAGQRQAEEDAHVRQGGWVGGWVDGWVDGWVGGVLVFCFVLLSCLVPGIDQ